MVAIGWLLRGGEGRRVRARGSSPLESSKGRSVDCLSAEERRGRSEFDERGATHLAFGDAPRFQ